ncbi:MAG: radical SAM protein [Nanoarchaeota archaeon]|nr:radical SAM protein [Nanoarchaeota archaeon]
MKIVFIIKMITISDPLGIMILSSVLKKSGHDTDLVCFKTDNVFEKLKELKPDIVAYSITTGNHKEYIELNKKIKKELKVYSIFGGPHPTFYPEMINEEGVDAICRGEGEEAFLDFIKRYKKDKNYEKTKNFWVKKGSRIYKNCLRKPIHDLDSLPFPDREMIYKKDNLLKDLKIKRFITSRGCPFKCTYCFNRQYNQLYSTVKGKLVRQRSVNNVIEEIKYVKENFPLGVVKFVDDTFNMNKTWLFDFCDKYKKEINLPFICNIRADLMTDEVAEKLKSANCILVYMGIETGDEKIRKEILERNMSNEQIINACKIIKEKGIKLTSQNMLGLPGEDLDYSFKTISLNSLCKPDLPGFSIFQPYPGTVLSTYSIENNYFDGDFDKLGSSYLSTTVLNYSDFDKRRLENLYKLSIIAVKFPIFHPIIKQLIKFPKNKLYDFVYFVSYGWSQWKIYSIIFGSKLETIKSIRKFSDYLFKT